MLRSYIRDKVLKDYKIHFGKRSSVRPLEIDDNVLILAPSSENILFAEWLGDHVLILAPSSENILFAEWLCPHKIIRKLKNNNYEVQLPKRKCVLHINMLKRFYERGAVVGSVLLAEELRKRKIQIFPKS